MKKRLLTFGLSAALASLSACVIVPDGPLTGPNAVPDGPGGPAAAVAIASLGAAGAVDQAGPGEGLNLNDAAAAEAQLEALGKLDSQVDVAAAAELFGQSYFPTDADGRPLEGSLRRTPKPKRKVPPKPTGGTAAKTSPNPRVAAPVNKVEPPAPKPTPTPRPTPTPAPVKTLVSTLVAGSGSSWMLEAIAFGEIRAYNGGRGQNAISDPGAIAPAGGGLYAFADTQFNRIRFFWDESGTDNDGFVGAWAGGNYGGEDGPFASARFAKPRGVAFNAETTKLYVADTENNAIRVLDFATREVSTVGGDSGQAGFADGDKFTSKFNRPTGVTLDGLGNVYVADHDNHAIRRIGTDGMITTIAGNGSAARRDGRGADARLARPYAITMDAEGTLYFSEDGASGAIRRLTQDGDVSTLVNGVPSARGLAVNQFGEIVFSFEKVVTLPNGSDALQGFIYMRAPDGSLTQIASTSIGGNFIGSAGLAYDPTGGKLYYTHGLPTSGIYRAEYR